MAQKRYKHLEDVIEDYLSLTNERIEQPLSLKKIKDKYDTLKGENQQQLLDKEDAEDFFKLFNQQKKIEERNGELESELTEVEAVLTEFLNYVDGHQITYEGKDDIEKSKITYLFWLENGQLRSNRELSKNAKRNKEYA